jgi:chemotaxis response regulator CheB
LAQLASSASVQRTLFEMLVKRALSQSFKSKSAVGKFCPRAPRWIVTVAMAKIVAIGASQGGVAALVTLVRGLPHDFPATILIALHVGSSPNVLPSILDDLGRLPAKHAENGDKIPVTIPADVVAALGFHRVPLRRRSRCFLLCR